jgi:hypothetical protein
MWKSGAFVFGPDFQARWKAWETRFFSFPRFPRGGISTALFISPCSERSDAADAFNAASAPPCFWAPFLVLGHHLKFPPKISRQNGPESTIERSLDP